MSLNYDDHKPISLATLNPWFFFPHGVRSGQRIFGWIFILRLTCNAMENRTIAALVNERKISLRQISVTCAQCTIYQCRTLDRAKIRNSKQWQTFSLLRILVLCTGTGNLTPNYFDFNVEPAGFLPMQNKRNQAPKKIEKEFLQKCGNSTLAIPNST